MTTENGNAVGDVIETGTPEDGGVVTEPATIPGTSFKSQEDLVKSYKELQSKLGAQGNELGKVTSQAQTLAAILEKQLAQGKQAEAPKGVDYGAQQTEIMKQLESLDPLDADFSKTQTKLISKLTNLVAVDQHEKTLKAATTSASELLKKELGDRDAKAAQEKFYQQNPDFKSPEMQSMISEFMANDTTGLHDPISAYFQIQRDNLAVQAKQLSEVNAEMQKRLDLAKGTQQTGKVIVKGQSPGQGQTNTPIPTGKDVDAGMLAALKTFRGES